MSFYLQGTIAASYFIAGSVVWGSFKLANAAAQDESNLLPVGVAKVEITPTGPIRLAGYNSRKQETTTVDQSLWAKALAVGGGKQTAVLICADLVGVPGEVREAVAKNLARSHSLDSAQLAICATHTHSGPYLRGIIPFHFPEPLPPDQQTRVDQYTNWLIEQLTEVAAQALDDRRPAQLTHIVGEVDFAINRRVLESGKWASLGVYPQGPVDHRLPLLVVRDPNGELRTVLATYACHATLNTDNVISGDWVGAAHALIEKRHPGAIAMMTIGCGADASPPAGRDSIDRCGIQIADEVERLLAAKARPITQPPRGTLRSVTLPYDRLPTTAELKKLASGKPTPQNRAAKAMLEHVAQRKPLPRGTPYLVQTWTFGDELAMVFLAGEPVVDYALSLRSADDHALWIHGYSNAHPGYIPSKRLYAEGGYEVDASQLSNGHPSRYAADVQNIILKAVQRQLPKSFVARSNNK